MTALLCPVVVGRDDELRTLAAAVRACGTGQGSVTVLCGEAGVGKSRLAREAAQLAETDGRRVVAGRATANGTATPFAPITEVLLRASRAWGLPEDDDVAPLRPALAALFPTLAGETVAPHDLLPVVRAEAVSALLRRWSEPAGLVVIVEDLHWSDPDSVELLGYLAADAAGASVAWVLTMRDDPRTQALDLAERLHRDGSARVHELERLGPAAVAAMVRACAPDASDETVADVQRAAEGVPFLVEEVLASPGVPGSFADSVRRRLDMLGPAERGVLHAAALLGRSFDWRELAAIAGTDDAVVSDALDRGVAGQLLLFDGDTFHFRHALTRDAVIADLLPPRRAALAAGALHRLETRHQGLPGHWREVAAELAAAAGDTARAAGLLSELGRAAFERGALATAAETLQRSLTLHSNDQAGAGTALVLLEVLSLAGRVHDVDTLGRQLVERLEPGADLAAVRVTMAQAEITATNWASASRHLDLAAELANAHQRALEPRIAVLRAEIAIAEGDLLEARHLAETAAAAEDARPETHCFAWELVGRSHRPRDLVLAREAFEQALAIAEADHLPVWRLRALHELGTVEMFDHAGTASLLEARRAADDLGVLSTAAIIDVHLAATLMFTFELERAREHAEAALAISGRLHLERLRALALMFLAEIAAMQRRPDEMEAHLAAARAAAPDDPDIEGSHWAGAVAMLAVLEGDLEPAMIAFERGLDVLRTVPQSGPANYRGLWPLLLASTGDERARAEIDDARRLDMTINRCNAAQLDLADAVLAGRAGRVDEAELLAERAEPVLDRYPIWGALALLHAAPAAQTDGWGRPERWLAEAARQFAARGFLALAARCQPPSAEAASTFTPRESEVLALVAQGLSNKDIARELSVSPRTVEKHVEALLRKTAARSRTQLVALMRPPAG